MIIHIKTNLQDFIKKAKNDQAASFSYQKEKILNFPVLVNFQDDKHIKFSYKLGKLLVSTSSIIESRLYSNKVPILSSNELPCNISMSYVEKGLATSISSTHQEEVIEQFKILYSNINSPKIKFYSCLQNYMIKFNLIGELGGSIIQQSVLSSLWMKGIPLHVKYISSLENYFGGKDPDRDRDVDVYSLVKVFLEYSDTPQLLLNETLGGYLFDGMIVAENISKSDEILNLIQSNLNQEYVVGRVHAKALILRKMILILEAIFDEIKKLSLAYKEMAITVRKRIISISKNSNLIGLIKSSDHLNGQIDSHSSKGTRNKLNNLKSETANKLFMLGPRILCRFQLAQDILVARYFTDITFLKYFNCL